MTFLASVILFCVQKIIFVTIQFMYYCPQNVSIVQKWYSYVIAHHTVLLFYFLHIIKNLYHFISIFIPQWNIPSFYSVTKHLITMKLTSNGMVVYIYHHALVTHHLNIHIHVLNLHLNSTFSDIEVPKLINLWQYIHSSCDSYTHKSLVLCQKYSLNSLKDSIKLLHMQWLKVQLIRQFAEYKTKKKLLQDDMQILFPLSGSNFTFKSRDKDISIKFQFSCSKKTYYSRCKNKSVNGVTWKCETSKPFFQTTYMWFLH